MVKNAIALLCRYPDNIWLNFLNNFHEYDVFIIIDENKYDYYELYKQVNHRLKIIQIDDDYCKNNGFYNFVYPTGSLPNKPLSWDKALFYFTKVNTNYNNVWFIEDDVFLLKESVLLNIDSRYTNSDLLTPSHYLNYDGDLSTWNLWFTMKDDISLPWAKSMTCACRVSNKLLQSMDNYRRHHNKLFFHETMFNTIALHNNLLVETPDELSTIHYRTSWDLNNLNLNNLYHPVKNYYDQLVVKMNNNIYYDNLFNNVDYSRIESFNFDYGLFLTRYYNLPERFNFCCYRENNNKREWCDQDIIWHWINHGQYENCKYKD